MALDKPVAQRLKLFEVSSCRASHLSRV